MSQVRAYDMLIFTSYEAASMCCSEGYLLEAWVLFNNALEFPTTFQNLPKKTCQTIENLMQNEAKTILKKTESLIKKLSVQPPEKKSRLVDLSTFSEEYMTLKKRINKGFTSRFPVTRTFPYIDELFMKMELFRELIQRIAQKNVYYRVCDLSSQKKFLKAWGLFNNAFKKTSDLPEFLKKQKEKLEENLRLDIDNKNPSQVSFTHI